MDNIAKVMTEVFGGPEGLLDYLDKQDAEESLYSFIKLLWPVVEPGRPFVDGWHVRAICEHLEAVTRGEIKRLLINVPPGSLKSICVNVMWPAWEWGPAGQPANRYLCASYAQELTIRDNEKFRAVINSEKYQRNWGDRFSPSSSSYSKIKVSNSATGFKYATSIGGVGTGERGDRVICDDPNNVKTAESAVVRESTNYWFREVLPNRLNSIKDSAIIVIQQRTHEDDVSGLILTENPGGWVHLCIPMEFEEGRRCSTSIGWTDPRTKDGEMMCPDLFDPEAYARLKKDMGPIAVAGQYQQSPTPRGGNIVQRDWWEVYEPPATSGGKMTFPPMEFVLASLDTAYTEKQENDYSALVVLGIWRDQHHIPKVMLIDAWKRRVTLHGQTPPEGQPRRVQEEYYGLVEWVAHSCKKWKVDKLLVEDKAAGHSVAQEIQRLYGDFDFSTELVTPRGDKLARLYSVVHLFTAGVIYAPDREYADMVINEICAFPKVKHDDLSDAFTQGLRWLRDRGLALRKDEGARDYAHRTAPPGVLQPLYDV